MYRIHDPEPSIGYFLSNSGSQFVPVFSRSPAGRPQPRQNPAPQNLSRLRWSLVGGDYRTPRAPVDDGWKTVTRSTANRFGSRSSTSFPVTATGSISDPYRNSFTQHLPSSYRSSSDVGAVVSPASPDPEQTQPSISISETAKDASRLLELFSKLFPRDNGVITESVFNDAFAKLLVIRKEYRLKAAGENKPLSPPDLKPEKLKVYAACIICYGRVADTVVIPCRHLSICSVCCDELEAEDAGLTSRGTAKCPLCRAPIYDKVTVLRG